MTLDQQITDLGIKLLATSKLIAEGKVCHKDQVLPIAESARSNYVTLLNHLSKQHDTNDPYQVGAYVLLAVFAEASKDLQRVLN